MSIARIIRFMIFLRYFAFRERIILNPLVGFLMLCLVVEKPTRILLIRQLLDAQGNYQQQEQFCDFLF